MGQPPRGPLHWYQASSDVKSFKLSGRDIADTNISCLSSISVDPGVLVFLCLYTCQPLVLGLSRPDGHQGGRVELLGLALSVYEPVYANNSQAAGTGQPAVWVYAAVSFEEGAE